MPRSLVVQCSSTAPDEKKKHLVGCHRGAEQRDGKVPIGGGRLFVGNGRSGNLVDQVTPIRMQCKNTHREHNQHQAKHSGDILHDRELHPPDHYPHRERRDRYPHHRTDVGGQLKRQRHTADLGGQRHQVDEERRGQVGGRGPRSEPFADDLEGSPAADGRHPSCHVRVQADTDHADDDHPDECQTEARPDHGIGHQVSDVDESADGGEDSECDREDLRHHRYPLSSASADASRSSRTFSGEGCGVM